VNAPAHPAGFRPDPPRPAWYVAVGGAFWGYLLALLLTVTAGALLSAAGLPRAFWGVDSPGYVVLGAAITAVCLRRMVARISWRILPAPSLALVAVLFSPGWLDGRNAAGAGVLFIVVVALLIRYRSLPDGRSPSSVGLRLVPGELDKVVSRH
jgi:hypothetical protein